MVRYKVASMWPYDPVTHGSGDLMALASGDPVICGFGKVPNGKLVVGGLGEHVRW